MHSNGRIQSENYRNHRESTSENYRKRSGTTAENSQKRDKALPERLILVREATVRTLKAYSQLKKPPGSFDKLSIILKRLDPVLVGMLKELFASQEFWSCVELNGTSQSTLSFIQLLAEKRQNHVQRLLVHSPTPEILTFLAASWLGKPNTARLDRLSLRMAAWETPVATAFRNGIETSTVLNTTFLDLEDCTFHSTEAVSQFAKGIQRLKRLERLSLSRCYLEDGPMALLLEHLRHDHGYLEELDLSVNFCQEQALDLLCQLLLNSEIPLQALNMSCQDVWDDRSYYIHLGSTLSDPGCTRLQRLDLSSNFLVDEQFLWLVLSLRDDNVTLQHLSFQDNRISRSGLDAFSRALPRIKALKTLDLTHNCYTPEGVRFIPDGLASNTSLTSLELDHYTTDILYFLALNRHGRYCKTSDQFPLALWSQVLEFSHQCNKTEQFATAGITPADIIFDLLHGPVLLER